MTTPPPADPYGSPTGQSSYPPFTEKPKRKKWPWIVGGIVAVLLFLIILGAVTGDPKKDEQPTAATTSTVTQTQQVVTTTTAVGTTSPPTTTSAAAVEEIEIPDGLVGMNAQLAFEKLQALGFTKITPSSTDESASVPVLLSNWTVTGIEPGAGTRQPSSSTIILKMSKD